MITQQKKVLILSGFSYMIEVVETAKKMGLYTIVADNTVNSPAKKYADTSYTIGTDDIEQLAEMARNEKIDGVFNAFDDINAWHALALCKKLDIPLYTAGKQAEDGTANCRFREYCRSFNVPVIEEDSNKKDTPRRLFPALIKPVAS
jgi:formate-dependent phosphoribosylglycinamide formyltransferase (GAR transformylase)